MSLSVVAALIWLLAVNLRAMFPSRDNHWVFAYVMIALGLPLLPWLYLDHGIWVAGGFLLVGLWVMRWPLRYGLRWLQGRSKSDF